MANRQVGDQVASLIPFTEQHEEYKKDERLIHRLENHEPRALGVGTGNQLGSEVPGHRGTLGGTGGERLHIKGLPIHTVEDRKVTGAVDNSETHTGQPGHVDYIGGRQGFTGQTQHDPWQGKTRHVGTKVPTSTKIMSYVPYTQANKAKKAGLITVKHGEGQKF